MLIRGGESGKAFTDKCSRQNPIIAASISGTPSKFNLHFEDDASPVDPLSDYHTDEFESDEYGGDDDDGDDDDDDDWENQNVKKEITDYEWDVCDLSKVDKVSGIKRKYDDEEEEFHETRDKQASRSGNGKGIDDIPLTGSNVSNPCVVDDEQSKLFDGNRETISSIKCNASNYEEESRETRDKQQQLVVNESGKGKEDVDERYNVHIYGYYRKSRPDGGYGIILQDKPRKPVVAYYGFSKGGSYLYYLLMGMKRSLEIANEWGLAEVKWSINSQRVNHHLSFLFNDPDMLNSLFHSQHDVCKRCLRNQMGLTIASFKQVFPVIEDIIKLQYKIKFKYTYDCSKVRNEAAYYLAECGAKKLEKMKPGGSLHKVQEVKMMDNEFPERLKSIVLGDEKLFAYV